MISKVSFWAQAFAGLAAASYMSVSLMGIAGQKGLEGDLYKEAANPRTSQEQRQALFDSAKEVHQVNYFRHLANPFTVILHPTFKKAYNLLGRKI